MRRSGICVRHDHLRDEGRERRQQQRLRDRARNLGDMNGQHVERDAQPTESERGLVNHRPRTQQPPVEPRTAQSLEVDRVGPVRRFHVWEIDAALSRRTDIEQRSARHEPTDRLLLYRKRVHSRNETVNEANERVSVSNVAGAADQRVLPPDQIERHVRAEVAGMHRHSIADVGEQLGRRSDEYRNVMTGGDRLTQHVAAQRSSGAQDDDAGHRTPTSLIPRSTSLLFLLRQSRRLVIVQFLPHDAKQDRALRVAGDQHAVVK